MNTPDGFQGLLAPERRAKILDLVRHNKSVLVKDPCAQFGVTGETIRKDLARLEQEGQLVKTYGGAYIQEGVKNGIDATIREVLLPRAKDSIGACCARLVGAGDTVFLDETTTCLAIARHLLDMDITVVTNSLAIAQLLADSGRSKVLLSGGELDQKNRCFVGGSAEDLLSRYYMDKSFVSCRGADRAAGITDGSAVNGRVRAMMLQRARERFLVLDHTKLNKANFFRVCGFEHIHTVVIDNLPDEDWRMFFRQRGIRVIETMTGFSGDREPAAISTMFQRDGILR